MIDSHCHLADEAYVADLGAVVGRATAAGVTAALVILAAGDAGEMARAARVLETWPAVRTSIGVHPHAAGTFAEEPGRAAAVVRAQIAADPAARAIGEIGLDYHYDFAPREVQQEVFRVQLRLARDLDLPVVIHTREADADTLRILADEAGASGLRGVFHCFTGDAALASAGLTLGLCVSFAGIVTFPKAEALRAVAATVPEDRLLIETDSPFLAPVPLRGKRNEPGHLPYVAEALARVRGVSTEALAATTADTFVALFRP